MVFVNVTLCPVTEGFTLDDTVVVVSAGSTVCVVVGAVAGAS
jgi:hypothetical protein